MMISPDSYKEMHENDTFEELIRERKELTSQLEEFEAVAFDKKHESEAWNIHPGPEVKYQVALDYLSQICEIIKEKYRVEIVFGKSGEDSIDK